MVPHLEDSGWLMIIFFPQSGRGMLFFYLVDGDLPGLLHSRFCYLEPQHAVG